MSKATKAEVATKESIQIEEIFGQFAIKVGGKVVLFETKQEAELAAAEAAGSEEAYKSAEDYCKFKQLTGKAAVGKVNVIVDFLLWNDAGRPPAPPVKEPVAPESSDTKEPKAPDA